MGARYGLHVHYFEDRHYNRCLLKDAGPNHLWFPDCISQAALRTYKTVHSSPLIHGTTVTACRDPHSLYNSCWKDNSKGLNVTIYAFFDNIKYVADVARAPGAQNLTPLKLNSTMWSGVRFEIP